MIKTFLGSLQLPVNPLEELAFSYSANNQRFEIVALGDVTAIGSRGLIKAEIKSLFTNGDYPFTVRAGASAEALVAQVQKMFEAGKPVRFIVTGDGLDINLLCSLESFKYTKPFGEIADYYYTLSLMEYREYSAKKIVIQQAEQTQAAPKQEVRTEESPSTGSHTVVSGDCLWNLAKQYYGDGSQYTKIWEANKSICPDPNLIYPGQTLVIP